MHDPRTRRLRAALGPLPVVAILGPFFLTGPSPDPAPVAPAHGQGTRIVLLGTGTPNADPERSGPALAVVAGGRAYLVDAGPGVVRRAARAAREHGIGALAPPELGIVFLTHLHSDHTVGLADLLLTPWTLGRAEPLRIVGPPGTEAMAGHLQEAYREDVRVRLEGLEPANATGWRAEARDVEAGVVYEDENVRVTAFPVRHGAWRQAFGYRFETADRTVVVSGDAAPSPSVVEACGGCDVLVHEVYAQAGFEGRSAEWQRYHSRFHTSGPELGRLAAEARPGLLVLTHQLLWGASPETLLEEVRAEFDGRVVYGDDLDVF